MQMRTSWFPAGGPDVIEVEKKILDAGLNPGEKAWSKWKKDHGITNLSTPVQTQETSLEDSLQALHKLVGLDDVKTEVEKLVSFLEIQKQREKHNLPVTQLSLHMVFLGNPGTGKTTVARIIANIFRSMGILEKGHLVECDRSALVGQYVGQTEIKTAQMVEQALGGILFIDEAYALYKESGNDFGSQAIDSLVKLMEDHRDNLVVIAAGYDEEMRKFINSNPGLRSRFNTYIHFKSYQPQELKEIFGILLKQNGYTATDEAMEKATEIFTKASQGSNRSFGNGRFVRNFFEKALRNHALRLAGMKKELSRKQLQTLDPIDLQHENL